MQTSWEHENKTWESFLKNTVPTTDVQHWPLCLYNLPLQPTHPSNYVQIKLQVMFAHNLNITYEFSMAKPKTKGLIPISFGSDYMRGIDELVCTIMPFMLAWYGMLWTRDFHHPSSHLPAWSIIWKIQGPLHCGWDFP